MDETGGAGAIDALWEYADPALSEARFRAALESAAGDARIELLTQVARTYSLRGRFDEAHALLDQIQQQLGAAGVRPRIRFLLERGRTLNSSGQRDEARALFIDAWEQGLASGEVGLAVDAAHMAAIAAAGTDDAIAWNLRGLELARVSQDPKARALLPAMLNNSAWDLHERGRYDEALALFEQAREEWSRRGGAAQFQVARWSVARCLRSLGRTHEALAILRALEADHAASGTSDGYVDEEIAENLAALGDHAAMGYFGRAAALLGQDAWFVANEAARLASLRARAGAPPAVTER